jgi:hypothetical protein
MVVYEEEMNMMETVKTFRSATIIDDMRDLERKFLALEESNALLQEDNQDLTSKLEVALHHHHDKDVTEMLLLTDLEQGIMTMIQEKLNLQNTIKALEHQIVLVELKDDADKNDTKKKRDSKRTSNCMSDMLLSPIKDEAKAKDTASKSPKNSSSPPPVINVDNKDASQAEILKQTIIAHKRDETMFATRINDIFFFSSTTGSTDEKEGVKSRKSEFENFQRMSDLSETSAGITPYGNGRFNQSSNVSVGTTHLAAVRECLELMLCDEEPNKGKKDSYGADHSIVDFDEGRTSWSDAGDSLMEGSSLLGDMMDANDSTTRSSGSSSSSSIHL